MKKRIAASFLWFYAGWFAGAFVAFVANVSPLLGPIVGVGAAAFVGLDPRQVIWTRSAATVSAIAPRELRKAA